MCVCVSVVDLSSSLFLYFLLCFGFSLKWSVKSVVGNFFTDMIARICMERFIYFFVSVFVVIISRHGRREKFRNNREY